MRDVLMPFDWPLIVTRNRADLAGLVMMLFRMVGASAGWMPLFVARGLYFQALRRVRAGEAALRRLIEIAARGLVVTVRAPVRAMPAGGIPASRGRRPGAFALFDARRPLPGERAGGAGPRIRLFGEPPVMDAPADEAPPDETPSEEVAASALLRRLVRMERALARLPAEARRLARWRARHPASLKRPMRPGRPPGHRARAGDDIAQDLLREMQVLALWALAPEKA